VARFLSWCEHQGVEHRQIAPGLAGEYVGQFPVSPPTKSQALAALRRFFDGLVTRPAVALNPVASVCGVKHSVAEGATPELSVEPARKLPNLDLSLLIRRRAPGGSPPFTQQFDQTHEQYWTDDETLAVY
jgi:hypothetical protein